jgi:hypothetical protein
MIESVIEKRWARLQDFEGRRRLVWASDRRGAGVRWMGNSLQDHALLLLLLPGEQSGARGVLKHLPDAFVGLGGALKVLLGANLLANILSLW